MEHFLAFLDQHLIPDWRKAWGFLSVKFDAYFAAIVGVWLVLQDDQREAIATLLHIDPPTMILIGIVVRVYLRLKPQPEIKP